VVAAPELKWSVVLALFANFKEQATQDEKLELEAIQPNGSLELS
jgi:hypothetical protein